MPFTSTVRRPTSQRSRATKGCVSRPRLDYDVDSGLVEELAAKLGKSDPTTVGQAARIEGMTPAA